MEEFIMTEKKHLTTVENIIALMKEEIENISPLRLKKHYTFYLHIMELHMDNYLKVKNIKLHKMKV